MPKFNTVKFNALPHHSPCAVLVTSDCCQPHRLSGFRRHRLLQQPPDPETSSPISFSGGIVRAHDHQNDNGHTGVSWTNAVLRRADTQEPMGRLDASQLGGPTSNRPPHEYRRIPRSTITEKIEMDFVILRNSRSRMNREVLRISGRCPWSAQTTSHGPARQWSTGTGPRLSSASTAWCGMRCSQRSAFASKIRVPSFLARSTSRRNARARSTNSSGSS